MTWNLEAACKLFKMTINFMGLSIFQSPKPLLLLHLFMIGVSFIFFLLIPFATPLSFNYTKFNFGDNNMSFTGNCSLDPDGVVQLVTNQKDKSSTARSGQATYSQPMLLWDKATGNLTDFTTHFSFVINSQGGSNYGDGLAFFLAPYGAQLPSFAGGALGLPMTRKYSTTGENTTADDPFVAVEFDIYPNSWETLLRPYEHVGIDINSMKSVNNVTWSGGTTCIMNGTTNEAWISYNSSSKDLTVVFTGLNATNSTIKQNISYNVDLRSYLPENVTIGFSAATGASFAIQTIHSWSFDSSLQIDGPIAPVPLPMTPSPNPNRTSRNDKVRLMVGLIVGGCVLVGGFGLVWFMLWKKKKRGENEDNHVFNESMDDEFEQGTGPKKFSYNELARATNNFVEEEKLGEGGFGGVYRGFIRDLNSYVAVKRISKGSKQGIKEYAAEVRIISRLRHKNLVQLIGWCHQKRELLLVYELMPNDSLASHLFKAKSFLIWAVRYKIAQGLASGLFYLHEEWEQCVIHRDIKSSNVMLDSSFNAKLGDFGLARLVDHGKESQTTVLAGTLGYIAPECLTTGKTSKESDVYSFGIVALEIACGRKPIDSRAEESQISMVGWVWSLYEFGKILEAADPRLCGDFDEQQMECLMMLGLWCAHPDYNLRPTIRQAIQVLNFEAQLPILPSKMPVATYAAPPVGASTSSLPFTSGTIASEGGQTQSSSYSYNTNSSQFTTSSASASASASLLHSH